MRMELHQISFKNMALAPKWIMNILTLSVSTVRLERVFSQSNLNKSNIRNRLETKTLSVILYMNNYFEIIEIECHNIDLQLI